MAIQVSDSGDMQLVLGVKDDGSPVVEKFADNADKAFDRAAGAAETAGKEVADATKGMAEKSEVEFARIGKGLGITVASVGAFAGAVAMAGMKIGDSMQNAAERIGIAAGTLQEMHYAAGLIDLAGARVNTMFRDMNRFLADTVDKGGKSAELLAKMGLEAEKLKNAGPADAFRQIAEAIARLPDPMQRTQASMVIFKKGGDDAMRFAGALREAGDDARTFGLVMAEEAYQGSDKFYNQLYRLTQQFTAMSTIVANHVAKAFGEMARIFVDLVRDSGALRGLAHALGVTLRGLGAVVVLLGGAFGLMGKALGGFAAIAGAIAHGDFKGAFSIFKEMGSDLSETIKKIAELEGKLLGLTSESGSMKKMGFSGGSGGSEAFGGASGRHTWSDILPGAEVITAVNEDEAAVMDEHYLAMLTRRRQYIFELQSMDAVGAMARQQIVTRAMTGELGAMAAIAGQMVGLMQSKSRTMFEIGKGAAIAEATISTFQAMTNALAIKPFWVGLAMSGVAFAKGMANIQAIRAAQFGSAAATPVFNANPNTGIPTLSAPANDSQFSPGGGPVNAAPARREFNLTLVGASISTAQVRDELIPMLNDAYNDGITINVRQVAA